MYKWVTVHDARVRVEHGGTGRDVDLGPAVEAMENLGHAARLAGVAASDLGVAFVKFEAVARALEDAEMKRRCARVFRHPVY